MKHPHMLILSTSPRRGNGDTVAERLACRALARGALGRMEYLRKRTVHPCVGCGHCASQGKTPGKCVFDAAQGKNNDQGKMLLDQIMAAPGLIVVAPVYFYGLPAQFKALIDRSQTIWERFGGNTGEKRPAYVVLTAARTEGEKLFEGSLLTLRCFFRVTGFAVQDTLLLRGLDGPDDARNSHVLDTVTAWSRDRLDW